MDPRNVVFFSCEVFGVAIFYEGTLEQRFKKDIGGIENSILPKNQPGSQNWWFGDPRTLLKTESNPSFLEGPS